MVKLVPTRADGQPALGYYLKDPMTSSSRINGMVVLTLEGSWISAITRFRDNRLAPLFGLPRALPLTLRPAPPGPLPGD